MIPTYRIELNAPARLPVARGAGGLDARRVQEWLCLRGLHVGIDSDFGDETERALKTSGISAAGEVDATGWATLTAPLAAAADARPNGASFGAVVVEVARAHLAQNPLEVGGDNRGPWVRHYCRGSGGDPPWCQGFASTIWAQAADILQQESPLDLVIENTWCLYVPTMVTEARRKGRFIDGQAAGVKPPAGSMFFVRGGPVGYRHVGIVEEAHDDGTMATIEGNTNVDGSENGYEVARRIRKINLSDFGRA